MNDGNMTMHKFVEFRYTISGSDGSILEQIEIPMHYIQGADNDMFPKVEEALNGCAVGDRVEVFLTPEESYGRHLQELVYTDKINNVPKPYRKLGARIEFQSDQGDKREFRVTKISRGKIILDGNHPLAGRDLTFLIEVINVRDATDDEIKEGHGIVPSTVMH